MKYLFQTCALFILLLAPLQANQDGVIVRMASVYDGASSVSTRVGQLRAGSRVSIFERKGGWKQVYSEQKSLVGWVRSYQVREGGVAQAAAIETQEDNRGFLSGLAAFSRKATGFFRSDTGRTSAGTATIGVRGLSEEEIKSAVADFEELEQMKQFASSQKRMPAFTSQGGLNARSVKHLARK